MFLDAARKSKTKLVARPKSQLKIIGKHNIASSAGQVVPAMFSCYVSHETIFIYVLYYYRSQTSKRIRNPSAKILHTCGVIYQLSVEISVEAN